VLNDKDGQATTTLERKINLVTIKSIALSNLRDDWLVCMYTFLNHLIAMKAQVLNLGVTEEGDPIINCVFKTELITHIVKATQGSVDMHILPT